MSEIIMKLVFILTLCIGYNAVLGLFALSINSLPPVFGVAVIGSLAYFGLKITMDTCYAYLDNR